MRKFYLLLIVIFSFLGASNLHAQLRPLFPKKPIRVQVHIPKTPVPAIRPINVPLPQGKPIPAVFSPQYRSWLEHQIISQAIRKHNGPVARKVSKPGLKNAYQVTPWLYRGAQPTRQGYEELVKMGIKTVINLRVTPQNKKLIEGLPLTVYQVPINPVILNERGVKQVMELLSDTRNYPIYVHCRYGSDRTGTIVALYRMILNDWSRENAIKEMTSPEFGFHQMFQHLVKYIQKVKVPEQPFPLETLPQVK